MEKKKKMKKIAKISNPKTVKIPTLLEAIEKVVELAEDSKLDDRLFVEAAPEIGLLSDGFGITPLQAVLFCVCMHRGPRRVDFNDLANYLDISKIAILKYSDDIDALMRRRLLRYRDAKEEDEFDVRRSNREYRKTYRKNENADYIRNYLEGVGWTIESISVVVGAMDLVSTLNSAWKPTTDNESSFGLLGWRYWEFTDWVDANGEWVADSDYTIIDNSIGRICWFRQYNLGWADEETFTLQAFSESKDTIENLTTSWITNYLYNTLTYNSLLPKSKYWYNYLKSLGNNGWKYTYLNGTTYTVY